MSNIALSWAFKCHVGNASAKAVLVYLADRADDDGTAAIQRSRPSSTSPNCRNGPCAPR